MTYYHDTDANVASLAGLFGFEPAAARAWLRCEGQATDNPSNPLNIRAGGVTSTDQTGSVGGFARFANAAAGLRAAHRIVATLAPSYGYGAILAAAGSGDAHRQARAVERSAWAAGHYGSTATSDGCIARRVGTQEVDMQLSDQVRLGSWIKAAWPKETGLADGSIAVNTALGSTYGYARQANERSAAILAQLTAQQATIDRLVAAVTASPVDAATLQAEIAQAIEDAVSRITVTLAPDASGG